jgi:hypothetical protein
MAFRSSKPLKLEIPFRVTKNTSSCYTSKINVKTIAAVLQNSVLPKNLASNFLNKEHFWCKKNNFAIVLEWRNLGL